MTHFYKDYFANEIIFKNLMLIQMVKTFIDNKVDMITVDYRRWPTG